ncbi:retropepsin-like aspartic protease [Aureivirga sp. CE67]|uniref:retropepsin-like aspartic protease n=1 Tax=Aureivirga sp. CE67 TaxID=1788983 RepID=UPI0018C8E334|nr:retropepsin-like aspartic protease [Aureivirga sp. CE67]
MASLKKKLLKKGYTKIKIKKIKTNHLEIKGKINGNKGRFIVDTGASNSCIGFEMMELFNLKGEDSETKAAGAGGTNLETQISKENSIKFNKWKDDNCDLVLMDLTHVNTALTQLNAKPVHGIIGADILEKANAIIDYKSKYLFLKK